MAAELRTIPLSSSMLAFDDEWNSTSIAVMPELEVLDGLLEGWNASAHSLHGRARITTSPDASVQLDFVGSSITIWGLASPATAPLTISLDANTSDIALPNTNASLSRIVLFRASELPHNTHSLSLQHAGDSNELLAMTGVEIQPSVREEAGCGATAQVPSLASIVGNATQTEDSPASACSSAISSAVVSSSSISDVSTDESTTLSRTASILTPTLLSSTSDTFTYADLTSHNPQLQEMVSSPEEPVVTFTTVYATPISYEDTPIVPSFSKSSSEKVDYQQNTFVTSLSSSSKSVPSSISAGPEPTVQSDTTSTTSAPSVQQIAATICGSLAGLAFLLLLIYICIRRRQRKSAQPVPPRLRFTPSPASSIDYTQSQSPFYSSQDQSEMRYSTQQQWTTFARTNSSSGHGSSGTHTSHETADPYLSRKASSRLTVANPDTGMRRQPFPVHNYILEETDSARQSVELQPPLVRMGTAGSVRTPVEITSLQFGRNGASGSRGQEVFWSLN